MGTIDLEELDAFYAACDAMAIAGSGPWSQWSRAIGKAYPAIAKNLRAVEQENRELRKYVSPKVLVDIREALACGQPEGAALIGVNVDGIASGGAPLLGGLPEQVEALAEERDECGAFTEKEVAQCDSIGLQNRKLHFQVGELRDAIGELELEEKDLRKQLDEANGEMACFNRELGVIRVERDALRDEIVQLHIANTEFANACECCQHKKVIDDLQKACERWLARMQELERRLDVIRAAADGKYPASATELTEAARAVLATVYVGDGKVVCPPALHDPLKRLCGALAAEDRKVVE